MPANPVFGGGATGDVNGVTLVPAYGQREQFEFGGIWAIGDLYQVLAASTSGNFTLGAGTFSQTVNNVITEQTPTVCFTYRERVYLGLGTTFAFSDNEDPTSWEEQAPGAGEIPYLSQYGGQDQIVAFSQLQGRLAVFGTRTIQMWNTDADPANFGLLQTLDNTGTLAPLSVQAIGDYDALYLDASGVRSLRAKEVTLNAYIDDGLGAPIDFIIQGIVRAGIGLSTACSVVDPETKNYWLYLSGTIFVLSRIVSSKIQAWSTYLPTDNNGATFTPQKFVVFNGQVFCRGAEGGDYAYGGANTAQYDNSVATVVLPFYGDKRDDIMKNWTAIQAVVQGQWTISWCVDPKVDGNPQLYRTAWNPPAPNVPAETIDSTYDTGVIPAVGRGTHMSIMAVSKQPPPQTLGIIPAPAVFSSVSFHYNLGEDIG